MNHVLITIATYEPCFNHYCKLWTTLYHYCKLWTMF